MALNFESFHVPQQNRKSKLRVSSSTTHSILDQENPTAKSHSQPAQMNPAAASLSSAFPPLQGHNVLSYQQQALTSDQGLSLSLSFHLDGQRHYPASVLGDFLKQSGEIRRSVPLGPFTGYASILKSSRFLTPAKQILEEICVVNCQSVEFPLDYLSECEVMKQGVALSDGAEYKRKDSRLIFMLDEMVCVGAREVLMSVSQQLNESSYRWIGLLRVLSVKDSVSWEKIFDNFDGHRKKMSSLVVYRRYRLYCQQMQTVVASFAAVAGLGNAAPYMWHAVRIVSRHFICLKNALLDQIQFTGRKFDDGNSAGKEKTVRTWTDERGLQNQHPNPNLSGLQQPVWRSQRGLPSHSVAVLKTWLFEHFLHPYPTDTEKQNLAQLTGLSKTQVSNWFINARVRLWKPMVEEIHVLESQQGQATVEAGGSQNPSKTSYSAPKKQTRPMYHAENVASKRFRNEVADICGHQQEERRSNNHAPGIITGTSRINLPRPLPLRIIAHQASIEMIAKMD